MKQDEKTQYESSWKDIRWGKKILHKTRQDKTRQNKTRQDKTRQDKTRQDFIFLSIVFTINISFEGIIRWMKMRMIVKQYTHVNDETKTISHQ